MGGGRKGGRNRNLRQILRKLCVQPLDPGRDAVMLPSRHTTGSTRKGRFWVALPADRSKRCTVRSHSLTSEQFEDRARMCGSDRVLHPTLNTSIRADQVVSVLSQGRVH